MAINNNDLNDGKKDLVRNVLVAATGFVPIAGGTLSFLLDKYLPSAIEARKSSFLSKLEDDLEKIPKETIEQIYSNPDYTSIIIKIFRNALEDDRIEKINAFRNIFINATINKDVSFSEQSFYVKLVTDLSIDQIRVLHLFYLRDYKKSISFGKGNSVNTYIDENWKGVDESYRFALVTEIMRYGLVTGSQKAQRENNSEGHFLSPLGVRFIEYIFSPVETLTQEERR